MFKFEREIERERDMRSRFLSELLGVDWKILRRIDFEPGDLRKNLEKFGKFGSKRTHVRFPSEQRRPQMSSFIFREKDRRSFCPISW